MEALNYTARVIEQDDVTGYIDIQPPIGIISEDALGDFGADYGTTVGHELTTAYTTRLTVTTGEENISAADRLEVFTDTARYILDVLAQTDQGLDIRGKKPDHTIVLTSDNL